MIHKKVATSFLKAKELAHALIRLFDEWSCLKALWDWGIITNCAAEKELLI